MKLHIYNKKKQLNTLLTNPRNVFFCSGDVGVTKSL